MQHVYMYDPFFLKLYGEFIWYGILGKFSRASTANNRPSTEAVWKPAKNPDNNFCRWWYAQEILNTFEDIINKV